MALPLTFEEATDFAEQLNKGSLDHVILSDKNPFLTYVQNSGSMEDGRMKRWGKNLTDATNDAYTGFLCNEDVRPPTRFKGVGVTDWSMNEHVIPLDICVQEEMYDVPDHAPLSDSIKEKLDVTTMSLAKALNKQMQVGPLGVPATSPGYLWLIDDALGANHNVGGIDNRDNAWWQSLVKRPGSSWPLINHDDYSQAWTYLTTADTVVNPFNAADPVPWQEFTIFGILDKYLEQARELSTGGGDKMYCWMTPELHTKLMQLIKAEAGICTLLSKQGDTIIGDAEHVVYRGITFVVSYVLPRGTITFINPYDLKFRKHPAMWLRARPWIEAERAQRKTMMINAWWGPHIAGSPMGLARVERLSHV